MDRDILSLLERRLGRLHAASAWASKASWKPRPLVTASIFSTSRTGIRSLADPRYPEGQRLFR